MWLNDQLGLADLGEVPHDLLLSLHVLLILIGAVGHLFGRGKEGMEQGEVYARYPYGARPLQRGTEYAAVLDVLILVRREVERLRL